MYNCVSIKKQRDVVHVIYYQEMFIIVGVKYLKWRRVGKYHPRRFSLSMTECPQIGMKMVIFSFECPNMGRANESDHGFKIGNKMQMKRNTKNDDNNE